MMQNPDANNNANNNANSNNENNTSNTKRVKIVHKDGKTYTYPLSKVPSWLKHKGESTQRYDWPIPIGEKRGPWTDTPPEVYYVKNQEIRKKRGKAETLGWKDWVGDFIRFTCEREGVELYNILSPDKHSRFVIVRALIVYALRCRGVSRWQLGKMLHRDGATIQYLQGKAVALFGDKLKEVSKLLEEWDDRQSF